MVGRFGFLVAPGWGKDGDLLGVWGDLGWRGDECLELKSCVLFGGSRVVGVWV